MRCVTLLETIRPLLARPEFDFRQLGTLLVLADAPAPMDFSALAGELRISKPAMTRALAALRSRDMAADERNDEDRRRIFIGMRVEAYHLLRSMGLS
jgi:DNA-binding MarR family transcriptional regulator